jgi:hypothetical protein
VAPEVRLEVVEMEVAMVVDSAGELVAEAREAERGAEQEAEMVAA